MLVEIDKSSKVVIETCNGIFHFDKPYKFKVSKVSNGCVQYEITFLEDMPSEIKEKFKKGLINHFEKNPI